MLAFANVAAQIGHPPLQKEKNYWSFRLSNLVCFPGQNSEGTLSHTANGTRRKLMAGFCSFSQFFGCFRLLLRDSKVWGLLFFSLAVICFFLHC